MLFPTLQFGMFFFAVFMISWGLNHLNSLKKSFLLLCSWVFYCSWDPQFLPLLIGCTLFNYGIGLGMDHLERKGPLGPLSRKGVLIAGIVLNLSTLGLFKYSGFLGSNLNTLLSGLGFTFRLPIPDLLLPLGISFFTFQGISYIVDVYSGRMKARRSPLDVMLFICFFPHLVSGPIVRASEFIPQLDAPPNPHLVDTNRALLLVFCGLFKKLVLANYLAIDLVDPVFEAPLKHGGLDSWLAFYGYAMQIYCDFSAYSDMAIGFAALLGYRFPENFNQPYRAASLQDFWRRWHISLSSWLRDYLFIPLGGSQSGRFKTYRNLFLTMFLGGIWHGAAWTFVFWGALHGTGLAIERFWRERFLKEPSSGKQQQISNNPAFFSTIFVFHFVSFGWIFFRSESFPKALDFLHSMTDFSRVSTRVTPFTVGVVATGALLHFLPENAVDRVIMWIGRIPAPVLGVACGILLMLLSSLSPDEVAPFIYFRF